MFGLFSKGDSNLVKSLFKQFNELIEHKVEPLEKGSCEYYLFCNTLYNGLNNMGDGRPSRIKIKLLIPSLEAELNNSNNFAVGYALTLLMIYLKILNEISNSIEANKCLDIIRAYGGDGKFYRNITQDDKSNFVHFSDKSLFDYMIEIDREYEKLPNRNIDVEFQEKQSVIALWDFSSKYA